MSKKFILLKDKIQCSIESLENSIHFYCANPNHITDTELARQSMIIRMEDQKHLLEGLLEDVRDLEEEIRKE